MQRTCRHEHRRIQLRTRQVEAVDKLVHSRRAHETTGKENAVLQRRRCSLTAFRLDRRQQEHVQRHQTADLQVLVPDHQPAEEHQRQGRIDRLARRTNRSCLRRCVRRQQLRRRRTVRAAAAQQQRVERRLTELQKAAQGTLQVRLFAEELQGVPEPLPQRPRALHLVEDQHDHRPVVLRAARETRDRRRSRQEQEQATRPGLLHGQLQTRRDLRRRQQVVLRKVQRTCQGSQIRWTSTSCLRF